jgi:phosphomannomutase/phosphoglucomutase
MPTNSHIYSPPHQITPSIFRAYDIRGLVDQQLTVDVVYAIALAIGAEAQSRNQKQMVIARDGRLSSPAFITALCDGLLESGCNVIDIGMVPTPMLYFATYWYETQSGVMLTGSHNPGDYNGLKIVLGGSALVEKDIQKIYQRVIAQDFVAGASAFVEKDISASYIERIALDVKIAKPLKIVVDAGNGVAGEIAPRLFRRLGCEVIEIFCEIDGYFPHHHPDPSVAENLKDLQQAVLEHKADVGLAFDGDGDRLGVVTNTGEIIWPDRQMMLFAKDILARQPGAEIIFDIKCTRDLAKVIAAEGGKPLMWKTGHSLIKSKMRDIGAPLGGEMSGHIFFKERWYGFDDGLYAGARLLEILSQDDRSSSEIFSAFPNSINTPEIKIPLPEEQKSIFMHNFIQQAQFANATINTIDGLRVDFANGWGLVRLSNTTPCLTLRFEADNTENLLHIQALFKQQLLQIDQNLAVPF